MDYILSFQNHDLMKLQIEDVKLFSQFLALIFGVLLFFPFRRNTTPSNLMDYNFTNSLRGIAMILIVVGHFNYYVLPNRNLLFIGYLGQIAVPSFLLLSGFAISESYKKNQLKFFFEKRFLRVYTPLILATALMISIDSAFQQKNIYDLWSYIKIISGFKTIDRNYWFLHFLFFWYFIFFIVFTAISQRKRALCLFGGALFPFIFTSFGGPAISASLAFPAGVVISLHKKKIYSFLQLYDKKSIFSKIAIFISLMLIMEYFIYASPPATPILLRSISISLYTLIILMFMLLLFAITFRNRVPVFYHFLGGISYELYLLHGFFMYSYDFILFKFPIYLSFFIYLFGVIIMSLALKKVSEKVNAVIATKLLCINEKAALPTH